MLCFANVVGFCDVLDRLRLKDGDLLHFHWTSSSLEFLLTTPQGHFAHAHIVPAFPDPLDLKSTESWGASLTASAVDILRAVLYKHDTLPADEVGLDIDADKRRLLLRFPATGGSDVVPLQEAFRAKPPLLNVIKNLSAGPYLVNLKEEIVGSLHDLHDFAFRGEGDRVHVLVDLTASRSVGFHALKKTGIAPHGVAFEARSFSVRSSRRTKRLVPASTLAQNPEGWVRLDLTTLLEELPALDTRNGLILSVSLEHPLAVMFKQVSREPRYVFLMQSRWLPEDIGYSAGVNEGMTISSGWVGP